MASGSKYLMEMNVAGNAEAKLDKIADGLGKVQSKAHEMSKGMDHANESLDKIEKHTKGGFFMEASERFEKLADKWKETGEAIFEHTEKFIHGMLDTAAEFEDIRSSLQFSFGPQWQQMYDKTFEQSKHLAFTFKQTADLVANMGKTGVNVFSGMGNEVKLFKGKTGEMIGALDILQDTLAGTGLAMNESGRLMRGVHEALVGNMREFHMGLSMSPKLIHEMEMKMGQAGQNMQKRFEAIIEVLGKFYGGATKLKELNFSFQVQQITDKFELLKERIAGGAGLKMVTEGLKAFQEALTRLLDDREAMGAIASAFQVIEKSLGWVGKTAAWFIDMTRSLLTAVPWLGKMVGYFAILATSGSFVTAIFAGLVATLAALAAGFLAIGWEPLVAALTMLVPLVPVVIALVGAVGSLVGIFVAGAGQVKAGWGGVGDTFEKIKVGLKALGEIWSTLDESGNFMLDPETANKLQENGIMDFVLQLGSWLYKLQTAWANFEEELDRLTDEVGPDVIELWDSMKQLMGDLLDSFGLLDAATDSNSSSNEDWADTGRQVADTLIVVVHWVTKLVSMATEVADFALAFIPIKGALHAIKLLIEPIINGIDKIMKLTHAVSKLGVKGFAAAAATGDTAKIQGAMEGGGLNFGGNEDMRRSNRQHRMMGKAEDAWSAKKQKLIDSGAVSPDEVEDMTASEAVSRGYLDYNEATRGHKKPKARTGQNYSKMYEETDSFVRHGDYGGTAQQRRDIADQAMGAASPEALKRIEGYSQKQNDTLRQILAALHSQRQTDIHLDGEKIGTALQNKKATVAGR